MKIEVGQDAQGKWAWMIRDDHGRVISSDDDYWSADLAMEEALGQLKRRQKGEPARGQLRQAVG
jgi:hypothetical protein